MEGERKGEGRECEDEREGRDEQRAGRAWIAPVLMPKQGPDPRDRL